MPKRILFLRSSFVASSLVAAGLRAAQCDFVQYPAWPQRYRAKLQKLDDPETAWQDLQHQVLADQRELQQRLERGDFDLIVLCDRDGALFAHQDRQPAAWLRGGWEFLGACRAQGVSGAREEFRFQTALPFSIAELSRLAPVVMVDLIDFPYLHPAHRPILEHCRLYAKRELPYDRFALYQLDRPAPWKERRQALVPLFAKLRAIPLGITDAKFHSLTTLRAPQQDIDVFWAGQPSNTLRLTAAHHLRKLAQTTRWNIVIADKPLPFREFFATMARSKITLSVAGGGWDCIRHYEAVALGSVPLINRPLIDAAQWHEMPEAIYFENTLANFAARIEALLSDAALRAQCLHTAETLIREQMLWSKIIDRLVREALKTPA